MSPNDTIHTTSPPDLFPDPATFRHALLGGLWRRWETGMFSTREEFWRSVERLIGRDELTRLLERGSACADKRRAG